MEEPKISVVMSVYNDQKYLHEAIESILKQTYSNYEFIIINDASTDLSREIILSYKDSRIISLDNNINIGLTISLNKCLEIAYGKYIARMDSDDISLPERLEKQIIFLENNKDYILVGTWNEVIDKNSNILDKLIHPTDHEEILKTLMYTNCISHGSVMFRNICATKYNEDYIYSQDYDLWTTLILKGKIANIPEFLYMYRDHVDSISNIKRAIQVDNAERIIKKYYQNLYKEEYNNTLIFGWINYHSAPDITDSFIVKIIKNKLLLEKIKKSIKSECYLKIRSNAIFDAFRKSRKICKLFGLKKTIKWLFIILIQTFYRKIRIMLHALRK